VLLDSGVTSSSAFSSAWEEGKGAVRLGRHVQDRLRGATSIALAFCP
jgi:hypothetical protein